VTVEIRDRIRGSLTWACIGDALGAPTEQRSIDEIRAIWGGRVERFHAPPEDAPFSAGRAAGQITDDSSQMLYLVDAYVDGGGGIDTAGAARAILRWADNAEYFPRFAGPTTKASVERLRAGSDPLEVGRIGRLTTEGTSNGAAMRVAPAGLAHPGDPEAAVRDAVVTCLPSHATNIAIGGACCVAAAVAAAMAHGASVDDVLSAAAWGAAEGERIGRNQGREVAGALVSRRLMIALDIAARSPSLDEAMRGIATTVGSGLPSSEAVPAAIGLFAAAGGDPFLSVVGGANVGDDTDTVACIAGGVAGALHGAAGVPADLLATLQSVNDLDLDGRVERFAAVVASGSGR
jgi:ADP-ribosylglycohydrolase